MPRIEQYTQQLTPRGLQRVQASPQAFGADQRGAAQIGAAIQNLGNKANEIQQRRQNRIDVIQKTRAFEKFYNESYEEFVQFQSEQDLVDPNAPKAFNQTLREKAEKTLMEFAGGDDARASLEAQIESTVGDFSRKMTQGSIEAQRQFINKQAGDAMQGIVSKVRSDPSYLPQAFLDAKESLDGLSAAMFPEDEVTFLEAAQQEISLSAIQALTDVGSYEEARDLIEESPFVLQSLPQSTQRQILSQINNGINEKTKYIEQTRNTIAATQKVAQDLGIEISPTTLFTAATGIQQAKSPQAKIQEVARTLSIPEDQMTPSMKAKIGYNIDLPGAGEVNQNQEFGPDGKRTVKGIGKVISEPFEKAIAVKDFQAKIDGAIRLFEEQENTQALLSAMITFQKLLDEGAIVREGDIVLQRSAQGFKDRAETMIEQYNSGQIVGSELVSQMQATARDFTQTALKTNKTRIDPYLTDARERGMRMLDIGVPQESYDRVFDGISENKKTTQKYSIEQIQDVAKQNGMTLQELLESSAAASGKSVEEIKKAYGIND